MQLNLEQDWKIKRHEYVDMSENEVVFNSFNEKQDYERIKSLQKSKREENFKKRKTESSRERKSNKESKNNPNMSLAHVVQLIQRLEEKVSMWERNAPNYS